MKLSFVTTFVPNDYTTPYTDDGLNFLNRQIPNFFLFSCKTKSTGVPRELVSCSIKRERSSIITQAFDKPSVMHELLIYVVKDK